MEDYQAAFMERHTDTETLNPVRDFQEINYPKKRTTEAQSTQRENFCISFGTFFYLEVS